MNEENFGKTSDGWEAKLYTIENENGMQVKITDYGATVVSILLPNEDGSKTDVALGFDSVKGYEQGTCYFGGTIGRVANRTRGASFWLEGTEYSLEVMEHGHNNLHSSNRNGFHKKRFELVSHEEDELVLKLVSPHLDQGFPGEMTLLVKFFADENNALEIHYDAVADRTGVVNLTNHIYFNLNGHDAGSIENHTMQISADKFTPLDDESIPTGERRNVAGTPMDFTKPHRIGERIDADYEQLQKAGGYDHNYIVGEMDESYKEVAHVTGDLSGWEMSVYTDLPGLQFYAGNFIDEKNGKGGYDYGKRSGLALETQYFPNCLNETKFERPLYYSGEHYIETTAFRFYKRKKATV